MKIDELKDKLYKYNVPDAWYSLDGSLKSDAFIIYKNYSTIEYFYFDEKGDRIDFKAFTDVEEAYDQLWNDLQRNIAIFKIKPKP